MNFFFWRILQKFNLDEKGGIWEGDNPRRI